MRIDRDAFLLTVTTIAACHAPAAGTSSASATPADPGALCDELRAANARSATAVGGGCQDPGSGPMPMQSDERTQRASLAAEAAHGGFACKAEAGGAWGVEIGDAQLVAPSTEGGPVCTWKVGARLVFSDTHGARLALDLDALEGNLGARVVIDSLYDLDGDGRPEALVTLVPATYWSCGERPKLRLLQAKGDRIVDYPVGSAFDAVTDADGDGRPDRIDSAHDSLPSPMEGLCAESVFGPPLLLHGRADGTFSRVDETARAWMRRECPSPPADPGSDVVCARVWGASQEEVQAKLPEPLGEPGTQPYAASTLGEKWAAIEPPFTLSRDAPPPLPGKRGP